MIAVPRESRRMLLLVSSGAVWYESDMAAKSEAGMIKEADATAIKEDMVEATVELKFCSGNRRPPIKKQQPRTSKIFDKILPSILAWTTRI